MDSADGQSSARPDGRIFIVAVLVLYFGSIIVSSRFMPYDNFWSYLQVQAFREFDDFLPVTRSCDLLRSGVDPIQNPENKPGHVIFNYPRIWLGLSYLGVSEAHTDIIVYIFTALFFLSALVLIGQVLVSERLLYVLLFCSPAVMLGVAAREHRSDSIHLTIAAALLMLQSWRSAMPYALLFFAALLKFFPIFAIVVALRGTRPEVRAARRPLFFVLFVCYLWLSREDFCA